MAEEYEPFDSSKKSHIDSVLIPDMDDAVVRIGRMRKNQPSKCKREALKIAANSVKYYSHVTVECEPIGEKSSLQGLQIYGPIDFSDAQNMSTFAKDLTVCLTEMNDLKKTQQLMPNVNPDGSGKGKFRQGRFSRIKSTHMIPGLR